MADIVKGDPPFRKMDDNDWKDFGITARFFYDNLKVIPANMKDKLKYAPLDYCPWGHPDDLVVDNNGYYCIVFDD